MLLKEVPDPQRFGVADVQDGRIVRIVEKPSEPVSNLAVTGIYMYDNSVYTMVDELEPSARGELEITDVNNAYLARGDLEHEVVEGWWTDAGTFESLFVANRLAHELRSREGGIS